MTMKYFISVLFAICLHFNTHAQNTFSKRYFYGFKILQLIDAAPDGGNYFSGRSNNFNAIIGKIDSVGNLQWVKEIGDVESETPVAITVLKNGNVVIALTVDSGSFSSTIRTSIISFDINGNHIFTKQFSSTSNSSIPANIIQDGSGFTIAIRHSQSGETRILKLDSLGNRINSCYITPDDWAIYKTWSGDYILNRMFGQATATLDSNLHFTGGLTNWVSPSPIGIGLIQISYSSFLVYGGTAGYVGLINSTGYFQWVKRFFIPNKFSSAQLTAPNSILLLAQGEGCSIHCSYTHFIQIDTLGNILQSKVNHDTGSNLDYQRSKTTFNKNRFFYTWLEKTGTGINSSSFLINGIDTTFSSLCNVSDTTYTFYSPTYSTSALGSVAWSYNNDSLITDSLTINNIWFSYADCSDSTITSVNQEKNDVTFSISPNPVNSSLTISFANPIVIEFLKLITLTGQTILTKSNLNGNSFTLDVSHLTNGIYIAEVISGNDVARVKVVKE